MPNKCPLCGEIAGREVKNKFYHCFYCDILIRREEDMPCYPGKYNYDYEWAGEQNNEHIYTKGKIALNYIKKLKGVRTILDVGCGSGVLVEILDSFGYLASGYDTSDECVKYAKQHFPGNFYSLSEKGRLPRFDLIILDNVIEHISEPLDFVKWVYSLMEPGGYVYIVTPNLCNRWLTGTEAPDHRIIYSPEALRRILREQGLKVKSSRTKTFNSFLPSAIFNTMTGSKPIKQASGLWKLAIGVYRKLAKSNVGKIAMRLACKFSEMGNKGTYIIMVAQKK